MRILRSIVAPSTAFMTFCGLVAAMLASRDFKGIWCKRLPIFMAGADHACENAYNHDPTAKLTGVLISFETMKFRRGHFRAKPDPLLARQLTCLIDGMHNTRMGSELRALSHLSCVLAKEAGMHGQVSFSRILPNVRWWYLQTAQIMTAMGAAPKCLSVFSTSGC
jgi:hypothetical protein